ncbi:unnamed protein product [Danaus chrysippus]|uniref:(African queen) hypothetical protein n=1 Tax=Danaus chrysippus TaxID=151541 RepID=A0A8J2MHE9_9NEOP|nr:unnamed protein product [Danaus chrysippus]
MQRSWRAGLCRMRIKSTRQSGGSRPAVPFSADRGQDDRCTENGTPAPPHKTREETLAPLRRSRPLSLPPPSRRPAKSLMTTRPAHSRQPGLTATRPAPP